MKLSRQAEIAASEIYHLIESGEANLAEGTPIGDIVQRAIEASYKEHYGAVNPTCWVCEQPMEQRGLDVRKYICVNCDRAYRESQKMLADTIKQRDDAIALNALYNKTRHEHRDFAKNAQGQRDDWMEEVKRLGEYVREIGVLLGCADGDDTPEARIKELREAHGAAVIAQAAAIERAEKAERDRQEALAWLENKSPDVTYESIVASLEKTEEQREKLSAELFKARQELTFLRTKLGVEPQRLCGGCGFLLGVSRVCLTDNCGNDYSNDPKAFAALEEDRP